MTLKQKTNAYCFLVGLSEIKKKVLTFSESVRSDIKQWQVTSSIVNSLEKERDDFNTLINSLPPLTQPLVMYRAYNRGLPPPILLKENDFFYNERLQSFSLSHHFAENFIADRRDLKSIVVRLDALPGTHVLPVMNWLDDELMEFEVIVPGSVRVHVLPKTLVREGRERVKPSPIFFNNYTNPNFYDIGMPMIDYLFILSKPGEKVTYYPDKNNNKLQIGGGKKVLLTDANQIGSGNVHDIIRRYLNKLKKTKTKTKKRSNKNILSLKR